MSKAFDFSIFDFSILENWINRFLANQKSLPRSIFSNQNDNILKLAESLKIFVPDGYLKRVTCMECESAHSADVILTEKGNYGYKCLFNGWIDLQEDDVLLLRFERKPLLDSIASVSGLKHKQYQAYADDRLISIGLVKENEKHKDWYLGYADRLDNYNVLSGITEALSNQFPEGPGLIVTPSLVNINLPLPKKHHLISLSDFLVVSNNNLSLNQQNIDIRLGRNKKIKHSRGRPGSKDITRNIWKIEHVKPEWPSPREEQAKLIFSKLDTTVTDIELGTIMNHIRDFENEQKTQ